MFQCSVVSVVQRNSHNSHNLNRWVDKYMFSVINNRHQIMASISSIDIDENSSNLNISYISFNTKLISMEKYTVLKAFAGIIIGLTFLLACIALG